MAANIESKPIFFTKGVFSHADKQQATDEKTGDVAIKMKLLFWTNQKVSQNKQFREVSYDIASQYYPPNLSIGMSPEKYSELKALLKPDSLYHLHLCPSSWSSGKSSGVWYELQSIDIDPDYQTMKDLEAQLT